MSGPGPPAGAPAELPEPIFRQSLDLLQRLVAISSPSGDPAGLERMAEAIAESFRDIGIGARIEGHRAGRDGVLPVVVVGDHAPAILAVGHMDTVLAAVEPTLDGDLLRGTGTVDMKAGLVAFWGALHWLDQRGEALPRLCLVVVPDEEVGGEISREVMRQAGDSAEQVWSLEPGGVDGAAETVVAGRRGLLTWHLDARGAGAHSGTDYWRGRSALLAAARWSVAAAEQSRPGDGPTVNVSRMVAGDERLVAGDHRGVVGSARGLNVVPDRAVVEGELRFADAAQSEAVVAALAAEAERIAAAHGVALDLTTADRVAALVATPSQLRLAERAIELARRRGWALVIERDRQGVSFPNLLPDPSAQLVLDGLGPVGGGMHSRQEHVSLVSLRRRIALIADLLVDQRADLSATS